MSSGRPRYGSRKIFFQRIWARLHGKRAPIFEDDEAKHVEDSSLATASDAEDRHSGSDDSDNDDDHGKHAHLPAPKSLKRRKDEENRESKKQRTIQL